MLYKSGLSYTAWGSGGNAFVMSWCIIDDPQTVGLQASVYHEMTGKKKRLNRLKQLPASTENIVDRSFCFLLDGPAILQFIQGRWMDLQWHAVFPSTYMSKSLEYTCRQVYLNILRVSAGSSIKNVHVKVVLQRYCTNIGAIPVFSQNYNPIILKDSGSLHHS